MSSSDCGTRSNRICQATGVTIFDRLIAFVEQAGTPKESATERDGVLSYAAESHAAGAGLGVGFMISMSGYSRLYGLVYEVLTLTNRGDRLFHGQLLDDVRKEKQYFLGGLAAGGILGLIGRYVEAVVSDA